MDLKLEHQALVTNYRAAPYPSFQTRQQKLAQLIALLKENEEQIIEAISDDFSYRSPAETELAEIYPSLKAIKHTQKHLADWMSPEKRKVSVWFQPAKASIMYQPKGVVGVIVPWNYPLYLALGPLIGAIAAGNRVMLKMSEFTPQFSQLFAKLCEQYLGDDWVGVITGGPEVGEAFSKLPFDHLVFTGSGRIGKKVMQAASENLTPVTLELGGKSPTIIDASFSLKLAVERLLFGKLLNAGQTCLAPDYIFVPENLKSEFVATAQQVAKTFYPRWKESEYTALASNKQFTRLNDLLDDAKNQNAEVVPLLDEAEACARKVPPALVLNTHEDMLIRQEEIFGPILPVVTYQEHDEVIDYINRHPRPLALYLFSYNKQVTRQYMLKTISGGVTLNDTILHVSQEELPFGGIGASGMGHYHGHEGFKTFSKAKSIFKQSRFAGTKLMYPPHNKFANWLLGLMKR
ncbi:coniferyl aldehyde dehydrogenase [Kangiella marina]|uniref:Aldehyde dehydrogenase n=1 Tax=Kangiella marina TaxID=1079178 RepID=A0ABP8IH93_9GAMM